MGGIITKINAALKRLFKEKGQSLTEFVLILAFCAAIGWAANELGITDAIGAVFGIGARPPEEMAAIGGGSSVAPTPTPTPEPDPTPEPATPQVGPGVGLSGFNWGEINPNKYFESAYEDQTASLDGGKTSVNFETAEASQADRLAADQKALENLARFFVGKTKEQVSELLKEKYLNKFDMGAGNPGDSEVVNLGHFRLSNSMSSEGTGMQFVVTDSDGLKASEAENIFKWMVDPENPGSVEYRNDYNYLVSDYVVSQGWVSTIDAGNDQKNGLKLRLEYDYSGKYAPEGGYANANDVIVIGAHVTIDPKSQFNNQLGGSDKKYNRMNSQGLDVQVRMGDDGEIQVDRKNTGIPVTNGKVAEGKAGTYNWYGESDYRLVKAYFDSKAIILDETNITHDFKKGELIKTGDNSWYVYASSSNKTLTVNNKSITNDFVKIETNTWRYWHENDKTEDGPNIKTIKNRGTIFTKDNGDIFVYVGKQPPSSGTPINIVTDINESNSDWIKIGNLKQSTNQGQGGTFAEKQAEIETSISGSAVEWVDYSQSDTPVKVEKSAGDIVLYNNDYYYVKENYSKEMSKYWTENPASCNSFIKITNNYIGEEAVIEKADWGNAKVYPHLDTGDIVIDSNNEAWIVLQGGDNYHYPLTSDNNNVKKM